MLEKTPYSVEKAVYHRLPLEMLRAGGQPYPVHVQIILSDLCNQNCSFCSYRLDNYTTNELFYVLQEDGSHNNNPNRMIHVNKARQILTDCCAMGVKAIQFTGGGEPTIHPSCAEIIRFAQSLGMETAVVSNGINWGDDFLDAAENCRWVRVSIDSGSAETYSLIRRVNAQSFERAWDNIAKLVNRTKGKETIIGVGFVITKENWHEIEQACQRASAAGVASIRLSAAFQSDGTSYFGDFFQEATAACQRAAVYNRSDFRVINLFDQRVNDLQGSPDYAFCGFQHLTTYIGADLNVYRCCNLAYNDRGIIGSISEQTFKHLWDSKEKQAAFADFDAHDCPRCQFNQKNHVINAALQEPPHVNFV